MQLERSRNVAVADATSLIDLADNRANNDEPRSRNNGPSARRGGVMLMPTVIVKSAVEKELMQTIDACTSCVFVIQRWKNDSAVARQEKRAKHLSMLRAAAERSQALAKDLDRAKAEKRKEKKALMKAKQLGR